MASSAEFVPLAVDLRFWQLAKQMSIQRLEDVFIEMLTNCEDAYNRMKPVPTECHFFVTIYGLDAKRVTIIDHANGMSADIMKRCLLSIGSQTSATIDNSSGSKVRGYFGRGAKDSTAAGTLTYHSIYNNLYSCCMLMPNGTAAMLHLDEPVTQELRDTLNLPEHGTHIQIDVLESYRVKNVIELYQNVMNGVPLRDLMSRPENKVHCTLFADFDSTVPLNAVQVGYCWPNIAEVVFDKVYEVPGYPGVMARFILNRSDTKLPEARFETELQYGILIRSEKAIHECTVLKPQWRYHIALPFLFGSIQCNHIMNMMEELESTGSSPMNPFAVLDPARKGGINVDHPFINRLYSIPAALIESYLPILTDKIDDSFIVDGAVASLIENLQVFAADILEKDNDFMEWQRGETGEFVRALEDVRTNYIKSEADSFPLLRVLPSDAVVTPMENNFEREVVDKESDEYVRGLVVEKGTLATPLVEPELISFARRSMPTLQIKFSQEENPNYQYNVYSTRNQIVIIIHIKYPLIAKYFSIVSETGQINLNRTNATFLSDLISEALARLLIQTDRSLNDASFQNLNAYDAIHRVFHVYESKQKQIDKSVDDHIESYLNNNKHLWSE